MNTDTDTLNEKTPSQNISTHKTRAKQRTRAPLIIAMLILLAGCGYGGYKYLTSPWESTDDAYVEGHVVSISPKASGHITRVFIKDNQEVKSGQLLAEIESSDYAARLERVRALVNGAKAKLRQNEADFSRYQALAAKDEISKQTLDHAVAAKDLAASDLSVQLAELRQAELNLSYTKIYAPQTGRVTKKSVEVGSFVNVGQVLMAIVPNETWVVANFKETQLKHMKPGQHAEIKVDAYGHRLSGHVDSLQSGTGSRFSLLPPENAAGNFVKVVQRVPVKIVIDNPDEAQRLVPGLSVEAEVEAK